MTDYYVRRYGRSVGRSVTRRWKIFLTEKHRCFQFQRTISLSIRALERDLLCTVGIMDEGDNMCAINNKAYVQE